MEWEESETLMKKPWSGHSSDPDPLMAGTMLITCKRIDRCSPRILRLEFMVWRSLISTPGTRDAICSVSLCFLFLLCFWESGKQRKRLGKSEREMMGNQKNSLKSKKISGAITIKTWWKCSLHMGGT